MARKRVIAYFMHEAEMYAARNVMAAPEETESYVIGEIDENDVPSLQNQGLIIQELPEPPAVSLAADLESVHGPRRFAMREATVRAAEIASIPAAPTEPAFYLVRLRGPLLESWRGRLSGLGVELLESLPSGAYKARLTAQQLQNLHAQTDMVANIRLYDTADTGPDVIRPRAALPTAGVAMLTFDVRLHRAEDEPVVRSWLEQKQVAIAGSSGRKIRVYLLENSPLMNDIPALPEVAAFEQYVPPKLHNDNARRLLGLDPPNAGAGIGLEGAGQIVGIADTGLDDRHPDFANRIAGLVALGRPNDPSDPDGHGTHVAGSVAGDGTASGRQVRGAAPKAQIFFQSIMDANGELGGLPLDLNKLFDEAYQNGARIHNNSWGASTLSMYTINSTEVDEFVAGHRDMLILISAGNEGDASRNRSAASGFVDWLSIGSPASCKNALTVGAARSDRVTGGYSQMAWGQAWPNEYPDPPIAGESISGNPECLAAFSSRGPCDDRRIKPDLVAPGTDIASTKSSRAPLANFWGPFPGNPKYAFMGGTSMATPLVAGCAALVREYYQTRRNHDPSAALLKATLINSTKWLTGADAVAPKNGVPNYHQGHGRLNMQWAVPNPSQPNLRLEFKDDWKGPGAGFAVTGQRVRYRFSVPAGIPWLRLTMAYTDLPARALQNNLNLFVQHLLSGRKWMGNSTLPDGMNIPDPDNNVESVRIEAPAAGDYLIQVSASNLLKAPQDFALVVTGEGIGPLLPF